MLNMRIGSKPISKKIQHLTAMTLVVLVFASPVTAGLRISASDGIVMTGVDGIVMTGVDGIVMTGVDQFFNANANGIVMTGVDGTNGTGSDGIVMTGVDSVAHPHSARFQNADSMNMKSADGIVMTGVDGIVMTGVVDYTKLDVSQPVALVVERMGIRDTGVYRLLAR